MVINLCLNKINVHRTNIFQIVPLLLWFFFGLSCSTPKSLIDDGFTTLFNGKNWEGWHLKIKNDSTELAEKVFEIDNDMVHVYKDIPDSLGFNTGENATHGMFYTNKKYSKFILKFEYKWGSKIYNNFDQFQYDAGMYYHVIDDKIWPVGFEYQVRYDHIRNKNHTGDFWAPPGTKLQWFADSNGTFKLPKDGGKPQPFKKGEQLAFSKTHFNALNDKWNKCEVIVMADKYAIHKLNGKVVNMATHLNISKGLIGLQGETAEIYYRNIVIKEFDKVIPIEYFLN